MFSVQILQGLPGSGKSTYARTVADKHLIFSADNFFMVEGVYTFDSRKIQAAHDACLRGFAETFNKCFGEEKIVIVDNTNTTVLEVAPYYRLAQAYGAKVDILFFDVPFAVCMSRQTKGVPEEAMSRMAASLAYFDRENAFNWTRTVIK